MAYPRNVLRAVFRWLLPGGSIGFNVLHFINADSSDPSNADCYELGQQLKDWFLNSNFNTETNVSLRSLMNFATILEEIQISSCDEPPSVADVAAVGLQGSLGSAPLPVESCVVISIAATGAGRRNRGRVFLPAGDISQMNTNTGRMSTTAYANYVDCWTALHAGIQATQFLWVIRSEADGAAKPVSSVVPHLIYHHQRRRNQ